MEFHASFLVRFPRIKRDLDCPSGYIAIDWTLSDSGELVGQLRECPVVIYRGFFHPLDVDVSERLHWSLSESVIHSHLRDGIFAENPSRRGAEPSSSRQHA